MILVTNAAMSQTTITFAPATHNFADYGITQAKAKELLDIDRGTIRNRDTARRLLELTLKQENPSVNLDDESFYCIINIVNLSGGKPRWYVYHGAADWDDNDFTARNRILGVQRPWMLVVHLNSGGGYQLNYQISVKQRLPLNIQHLSDLVTLAKTVGQAPSVECQGCLWWAGSLDGKPPSDITITPQIALDDGSRVQNLDDSSAKFENEGLYHWDVSIGVPILSYKQLQLNNANGMITMPDIDKRDLLALVDFYPKAVDLKGSNFAHWPYLVGGVAMANKPLQKVLAGVGYGPILANFYGGVMIVTEPKPGTSENRQRYQAAFGLNLPVGAILDKLGVKH